MTNNFKRALSVLAVIAMMASMFAFTVFTASADYEADKSELDIALGGYAVSSKDNVLMDSFYFEDEWTLSNYSQYENGDPTRPIQYFTGCNKTTGVPNAGISSCVTYDPVSHKLTGRTYSKANQNASTLQYSVTQYTNTYNLSYNHPFVTDGSFVAEFGFDRGNTASNNSNDTVTFALGENVSVKIDGASNKCIRYTLTYNYYTAAFAKKGTTVTYTEETLNRFNYSSYFLRLEYDAETEAYTLYRVSSVDSLDIVELLTTNAETMPAIPVCSKVSGGALVDGYEIKPTITLKSSSTGRMNSVYRFDLVADGANNTDIADAANAVLTAKYNKTAANVSTAVAMLDELNPAQQHIVAELALNAEGTVTLGDYIEEIRNISKFSVVTEGNGTAEIISVNATPYDGVINIGDSVVIEATADAGSIFAGWVDGNNKVCTESQINVIAGNADKYTAVFKDEAAGYTVSFLNRNFSLVTSVDTTSKVDAGEIPAFVSGLDYTFAGWAIIGGGNTVYTSAEVAEMTISANTIFVAKFTPNAAQRYDVNLYINPDRAIGASQATVEYDVTIGSDSQSYTYDAATVTAAAKTGTKINEFTDITAGEQITVTVPLVYTHASTSTKQVFQYWYKLDANGNEAVVSYDTSYTFFATGKSADIDVYAKYGQNYTHRALASIQIPNVYTSAGTVSFLAERYLPAEYAVVETGMLVSRYDLTGKSLVDADGAYVFKKAAINAANAGQYLLNVHSDTAGSVYAKAYMTYFDEATSKYTTIYSDVYSAELAL